MQLSPYIGRMTLSRAIGAVAIVVAAWLVATVGYAGERAVVVELFTSEGCSSCPPAHAVIGRIANNPRILALSFHVDYWDYIGWKDSFAAPWATLRQQKYASRLSDGRIYTPQMVISGRVDVVGSRVPQVMRELERAIAVAPVSQLLRIESIGDRSEVVALDADGPAEIYAVRFDPRRDTRILRGENRGRHLSTFNVVRTYRKVFDWNGRAQRIPLPDDLREQPGEVMAVIAQRHGQGDVVGIAVAD